MTEIQVVDDQYSYDDANEFFTDTLLHNIINKHNLRDADSVIFRGQANASWHLVPSACRRLGLQKLLKICFPEKITCDYSDDNPSTLSIIEKEIGFSIEEDGGKFITDCEQYALAKFILSADQYGLDLYDLSSEIKSLLMEIVDTTKHGVIPINTTDNLIFDPTFDPLFALAQHHGIPTRLLDWSRSPHIAAYFAASTALNNNNKEDIALWVMNIDRANYSSSANGFRIIQVPYRNNINLRAQQGLFLFKYGIKQKIKEDYEGFDMHYSNSKECPVIEKPMFLKYTLKFSEVENLLSILNMNNINRATIFPGLDNIAQHIYEY